MTTATTITGRTQWEIFRRRFLRHRLGVWSALGLALIVIACVVIPIVSPISIADLDEGRADLGPSGKHWFGTGRTGEDIFVQTFYGGRTSLVVGLGVAIFATIVGVALGAAAGYAGGWVDGLIGRVTDVFLAAPPLAVLIALASVTGTLSVPFIILIIAALSWMTLTRLVRAEVIALKEREFVLAARAAGASPLRILWRHILPNAASTIIVFATLTVGIAILTESTLSFLGIGVNPLDQPTWGNLLDRAQNGAQFGRWWPVVFPGLFVVLTVLFVNLVGDALRDALDPYGMSTTRD